MRENNDCLLSLLSIETLYANVTDVRNLAHSKLRYDFLINLAGNHWALTSPPKVHPSEVGAKLSIIGLFGNHLARSVLRQMCESGSSLRPPGPAPQVWS